MKARKIQSSRRFIPRKSKLVAFVIKIGFLINQNLNSKTYNLWQQQRNV